MLRRGMSQREALKILQENGFMVSHRRGTGELKIRHPDMDKLIVMRKKKDLPSEVVHLVKRFLVAV